MYIYIYIYIYVYIYTLFCFFVVVFFVCVTFSCQFYFIFFILPVTLFLDSLKYPYFAIAILFEPFVCGNIHTKTKEQI